MAHLALPDVAYKDSYLQALREYQAEGHLLHYNWDAIAADFAAFVDRLLSPDPYPMPRGRVPESIFWLIEGDEYVGRVSIRHQLTEAMLHWGGNIGYEIRPTMRRLGYGKQILRLGLAEACKLGMRRVLLTCYAANIGSRKIIEANGGVLENEVEVEGKPALRYWIDIPQGGVMDKVNLAEKFSLFSEYWSPKIVGELNDSYVKVVKVKGEFVWHSHAEEDEMFLVIKGRLCIQMRDCEVWLEAGEFLIVPKGVEHRPVADEEVQIVLLEPKTTVNTGNVQNELTATLERI